MTRSTPIRDIVLALGFAAWIAAVLPIPSAAMRPRAAPGQAPPAVSSDVAAPRDPADPADAAELFQRDVRPLLADRCLRCHGGGRRVKAGLRMTTREELLRGGLSGPALRPGDPETSLLVRAVRHAEPELQMPPSGPLDAEQVAALEGWVAGGAPWPGGPLERRPDRREEDGLAGTDPSTGGADGAESGAAAEDDDSRRAPLPGDWAFAPVEAPSIPELDEAGEAWARDDLDRFVHAARSRAGLGPAPEADRRTWLRRVTFDLTGLPPTPEETHAFLADAQAGAYERVVDRLLASRAYAERQARHWLDVARYADTAGDSSDYPIPQARLYRDWVIDAFAEDLPFDRFLTEQIAGDLLAKHGASGEAYADLVTATGYLALSRRFGVGEKAAPHLVIEDTIDTLGRSVLGLTLRCARCHDHKFDPISQDDYYGLYGFFASTRYPFPGSENQRWPEDLVPLVPPDAAKPALEAQAAKVGEARAAVKAIEADIARLDDERRKLEERAAAVEASIEGLARIGPVEFRGADAVDATGSDGASLVRFPKLGLVRGDGVAAFACELPVDGSWRIELTYLPAPSGAIDVVLGDRTLAAGTATDRPSSWSDALVPRREVLGTFDLEAGARELRIVLAADGPGLLGATLRPVEPADARVAAARERVRADRDAARRAAKDRDAAKKKLGGAKRAVERARRAQPDVPLAYAVVDAKPRDAKVQKGGNPRDLGPVVPRRFPAALADRAPEIPAGESGRLELARWVASPDNPLTPRVLVNRVWYHHFGRGLVASLDNFGELGARPSHPELLDHLAAGFLASGGSRKALHRRIVLSATYRQSSAGSDAALERDPDNVWLARMSRRRLDAESMRDAILAVSGTLDPEPGGDHPFPPVAKWNWTQHNPFRATYETAKRSVYVMRQRIRRHPYFGMFDGADPNACTAARPASTVPNQALWFLNGEPVHRAAEAMAGRVLASAPGADERVRVAWELAFARPATAAETDRALAHVYRCQEALADREEDRAARERAAWTSLMRAILGSNELLYLD